MPREVICWVFRIQRALAVDPQLFHDAGKVMKKASVFRRYTPSAKVAN